MTGYNDKMEFNVRIQGLKVSIMLSNIWEQFSSFIQQNTTTSWKYCTLKKWVAVLKGGQIKRHGLG